jgi:hypothetical protein
LKQFKAFCFVCNTMFTYYKVRMTTAFTKAFPGILQNV